MKPQFLIGSSTAGSGKTTFTLGLLRILQRRGLKVQPFRSGPDPVDPQYHNIISERGSVNLDVWMSTRTHLQSIYNQYAEKADVCAIEGNLGLFDGYHRMKGSSAELAHILNIPIILIINARATSYSIAPLLFGFKHFSPSVRIAGVIFNQVSSPAHFASLREACTDAGIDCLGYIPFAEDLRLIQRKQGITQAVRQMLTDLSDRVANQIEKHVDLDKLLALSTRIFPCPYTLPYTSEAGVEVISRSASRPLRIAIARDPAFNLTYRENIDQLSEKGKITYFSPLYGSDLPTADLVYLPGGYPELFARQLHRRKRFMTQLKQYAEAGGKILAEGGSITILGQSLTARQGGTAYEMAGILPIHCAATENRLNAGYRQMNYAGIPLRGYEFHYSVIQESGIAPLDILLHSARGTEVSTPLYRYKNVLAGYTHWYWGATDIFGLWKGIK